MDVKTYWESLFNYNVLFPGITQGLLVVLVSAFMYIETQWIVFIFKPEGDLALLSLQFYYAP